MELSLICIKCIFLVLPLYLLTKYSGSDKKINIDIEMFEVLYIIIYVGCNRMNLLVAACVVQRSELIERMNQCFNYVDWFYHCAAYILLLFCFTLLQLLTGWLKLIIVYFNPYIDDHMNRIEVLNVNCSFWFSNWSLGI